MGKISIRISEGKQAILAAAARRDNKTLSAYIRDLLEFSSPAEPASKSEWCLYILTRLQLLSLAQTMTPEQVMENYEKIKQDADEKFRWE